MLGIISHINTDFDSLASMVAIKKLYPNSIMVFTGSPENNVKNFLKDFPEFSPKKERNINLNQINSLIIVDTARKSRIGNFSMLLNNIVPELIIDHHDESSSDIVAKKKIIRKSGATITILIEMLKEREVEISPYEATLMALGIYEDTNFFTNVETTEKDFEAIAYLFSKGADIRLVNKYLTREMTGDEFRLLTQMAENLEEINIKSISVWFTYLYLDYYFSDIASLIQKLKKIYQIDVLFAYIVMDRKVLIIARSSLEIIHCNEILRYWGGGGHPTAASVTIDKGIEYDEIITKIIELIEDDFSNWMTVEKLMSSPVETIEENVTIDVAKEKILQVHHNTLIVVDKKGNFRGLVSRDDIYKALHHNLNKFYVYEIMDIDVITIQKDTPIELVKKIIFDTQQRKFPVVENNKVIGIITANDIINTFLDNDFVSDNVIGENLKDKMNKFFTKEKLDIVKRIGSIANELGYKAYLVGGIVRDILLNRNFDDVDIVIEGETINLLKEIKKVFGVNYIFHKRFNTSKVFFSDFSIDIASARKELYIEPGALPKVERSFLRYDLYRRDFSINAMAISLNKYNFGVLIDFFNGKKDLETKIVRVLHNLSFIEDPTRIIRAVRYEQRFGFKIGKHTLHLLKIALKNDILKKISVQRLQDEFIILLKEESPVKCLKRLDELNILKAFPVKIILDNNTLVVLENIELFISKYRKALTVNREIDLIKIYLIGLLYHRSYQEIADFFHIFVFSKEIKEEIKKLKKISNDIKIKLANPDIKKSELYFVLNQFSIEILIFFISLFEDIVIKNNIKFYMEYLKDFKININGNDLIKLGLEPGEYFKRIFYEVKKARLDGVIDKDQEREFVKNLIDNGNIF